jgi:UDP-N-acetylmuramate dehydrogenase
MLNILKDVQLSEYTTFKIGGPAKFFVEVENEEEIIEALNYAKDNNLKYFILGGGSNTIFSDKGFEGLIIKIHNSKFIIQNSSIECGAGLPLSELVNLAKDNSLSGLEWAAGIPGTVGGAIRGNCGAFGHNFADVIKSVKVLNTNDLVYKIYDIRDYKFDYRDSIFKQNSRLVVISAELALRKGKKDQIEAKMRSVIAKRAQKQPKNWYGSAGSFFKNPIVTDKKLIEIFEKEKGIKVMDSRLPAGWLIEEADLKGKKIGGVMVSEEQANFILNTGQGTMEETAILISIIKQSVRDKFGIELEEEVKIVI